MEPEGWWWVPPRPRTLSELHVFACARDLQEQIDSDKHTHASVQAAQGVGERRCGRGCIVSVRGMCEGVF